MPLLGVGFETSFHKGAAGTLENFAGWGVLGQELQLPTSHVPAAAPTCLGCFYFIFYFLACYVQDR